MVCLILVNRSAKGVEALLLRVIYFPMPDELSFLTEKDLSLLGMPLQNWKIRGLSSKVGEKGEKL